MQTITHLSELSRISDPVLRDWVDARWRGVLEAGADACFLLLAPAEPPLQVLWSATVGEDPGPASLAVLAASFEYVLDHGAFFEAVILANHEAGLIIIVPKSARLEPAWADYLSQAALPAVDPIEALPHAPTGVSHDATPQPVPGDPQPAPIPSRRDPGPHRDRAEGHPDRHQAARADPGEAGEAAMSAASPVPGPSAPLFSLGQVVATPHALKVMEHHGVAPLSLLQRHVQGDWGAVCQDDAKANRDALRDGTRLLSSYPLADGIRVWIITEADRSATTLLMPEDY